MVRPLCSHCRGAGSLVGELRPHMPHSQKKLKFKKKKNRKETTFGCFCLLLMVIWVPLMFSENSLEGLGNLTFKSLKMRDEPRRVTFKKGMVAWVLFCLRTGLCVQPGCSKALRSPRIAEDHRDFSTPCKVIPCKLEADSPRSMSPMKRTRSLSGPLPPRITAFHYLLSFSPLHRILLKSS